MHQYTWPLLVQMIAPVSTKPSSEPILTELLSSGPLGTNYNIFQEYEFEYVICKMAAILSLPQCVKPAICICSWQCMARMKWTPPQRSTRPSYWLCWRPTALTHKPNWTWRWPGTAVMWHAVRYSAWLTGHCGRSVSLCAELDGKHRRKQSCLSSFKWLCKHDLINCTPQEFCCILCMSWG